MLRALWFAVKIGLIIAAAVWLAERPGMLEFDWMDYHIRLQVGTGLVILLLSLLAILVLYRLLLNIREFPRWVRAYRRKRRTRKGQQALMLGLSAIAAGDSKTANYQAFRARRNLPEDRGLTVLLEAQAARLQGNDQAAREAFHRLMAQKETAFLGLRGLLIDAIERNDLQEAENLSRQALKMHPKQPWVLRTSYELEIRRRNWAAARSLLNKAQKHNALPAARAETDELALLILEAEEEFQAKRDRAGYKKLHTAYKKNPAFIPTAIRLAEYHLKKNRKKPAQKILEKSWKNMPHPDLVPLWRQAAPAKYQKADIANMKWFEKLVALRPDSVESQIAAAEEAIRQGLWGQARQYLAQAETLRPSARLYRLWAHYEDVQGHTKEAKHYLEKAANAPADKMWICTQSGRIYESWSPVAAPEGLFNAIVWDYPHQTVKDKALSDRTALLITAP